MKKIILIVMGYFLIGCDKKLDLRPNSSLLLPETVQDLEALLENTSVMAGTPALAQLSADEYVIPTEANFQEIFSEVGRSTYTWDADIYKGQSLVIDWTTPYAQLFYCNSVLDVLEKQQLPNSMELQRVKGWALFIRAYTFYNLVSTFAKAYNPSTAATDLGIPLKLTSAITVNVQRSSVKDTYAQLIADAISAAELLQDDIIATKRNRPSKVAAYAFLARVYLSMRDYENAEQYADKALALHSKLVDYNTLKIATSSSFSNNFEETIYYSRQVIAYSSSTYSTGALYGVNPELLKLYETGDLRKDIYFRLNVNGNYAVSKGINSALAYPFTGLATDELYLIKAECLARKNNVTLALDYLNKLVENRMKKGSFIKITAAGANDALDKILLERRKALVWRSLRWTDIKRLNLEGRNIILTRKLGDKIYTLMPNSPLYVLPIPDDEIALSGIAQNIR